MGRFLRYTATQRLQRFRKNTKKTVELNKGKALIGVLLYTVLGMGWAPVEGLASEHNGSPALSEIVLFGVRPTRELDPASYRRDGQQCVKAYIEAISPKSYSWLQNVPSGPDDAVSVRRRNLEEQIVVIFGEKARSEATAFASAAPLLAEWERMSEGPVGEADFAEQWLTKYPDSSIAPFLNLFMAHRFRAGYEAARAGHEKGLWPILARRYRDALDKVRYSSNPLVSCIANDLEALDHVYLEGYGRP
jgi:hypothetical protein